MCMCVCASVHSCVITYACTYEYVYMCVSVHVCVCGGYPLNDTTKGLQS